jgi:CRISPR/Cas system CSM-associated protein Csm3 (group 7 of RAMP superfamily)
MYEFRIQLSLTCSSPPSVGDGGSHGTLADKTVVRNSRGRFVIPASQVRGKLRHACEQLLRAQGGWICEAPNAKEMCAESTGKAACISCQIFGSPGYASKVFFHDLVASQRDLPSETLRPMVSINRYRRTAENQRLFLVETAPNLKGLSFEATDAITGYLQTPAHLHVILAALKMLYAWGGGSSRGLGWGTLDAKTWLNGAEMQLDMEEVKGICQSSHSK